MSLMGVYGLMGFSESALIHEMTLCLQFCKHVNSFINELPELEENETDLVLHLSNQGGNKHILNVMKCASTIQ